ncbi:MAG: Tetratricopeptide repeat-containing protein [Candidatus Kentron sp. G]|nr:MAG: Tetratricopeptide repeat-containing protein [Candidatus Kentron sp. G]
MLTKCLITYPRWYRNLSAAVLVTKQTVLGEQHPAIATSLNNLGLLVWKQGDRPAALAYLTRALEIWETALPAEHPDILESLWNLGELCRRSGRLAEAEGYFARARDIKARHPEYPGVSQGNRMMISQIGNNIKTINISMLLSNNSER